MPASEFETWAKRLKIVAESNRLRIIACLFSGEATVSDLCEKIGQPITMVSHHLGLLLKADIVQARKDGRFVYYSLRPDVARPGAGSLIHALNLGNCSISFASPPPAAPPYSGLFVPEAECAFHDEASVNHQASKQASR